jgi:hypothetical protein
MEGAEESDVVKDHQQTILTKADPPPTIVLTSEDNLLGLQKDLKTAVTGEFIRYRVHNQKHG